MNPEAERFTLALQKLHHSKRRQKSFMLCQVCSETNKAFLVDQSVFIKHAILSSQNLNGVLSFNTFCLLQPVIRCRPRSLFRSPSMPSPVSRLSVKRPDCSRDENTPVRVKRRRSLAGTQVTILEQNPESPRTVSPGKDFSLESVMSWGCCSQLAVILFGIFWNLESDQFRQKHKPVGAG